MVDSESFDLDDDMALEGFGLGYVFVDVGGWFARIGEGDCLHVVGCGMENIYDGFEMWCCELWR